MSAYSKDCIEISPESTFEDSLPVWKTKAGGSILISEMETKHIKNCLKMLRKDNYIGVKELAGLLCFEVDMAFEPDFDEAITKIPINKIDYFKEELNKRGESE
jgi:hypothetical protein